MRVSRTMVSFLAAGLTLAAPACGSDDPAGPPQLALSDLAGSWITTSFEFAQTDGGTSIEIIGLGAILTFSVAMNGGFTADFDPGEILGPLAPHITGGTITGTIVVGSNTLTIHPDFDPEIPLLTSRPLEFQVRWGGGSTITLTDARTVFDFSQDGQDEPATLMLVIQRA
jgi:hypothetical protein